MKLLYHGTRYLKKILADECLRLPAFGEEHVSLTTRKYVANYWAEMPRDNVIGFGYIISLDWNLLLSDGYILQHFDSGVFIKEHEIACNESIEPIGRYIVKIERVADSFMGVDDIAKISPLYWKHHHKRLWELDKQSWHPSPRGIRLVEENEPRGIWNEDSQQLPPHPTYSIEDPYSCRSEPH